MTDGKGCECFARCEADCVCDADWTPEEVIRLRAELAVARADLAVSVGHLSRLAAAYGCEDFNAALMAAIAAKEE